MHALHEKVETLMRENRRETNGYQYTIPSPELYPFQWLWDSCFHAIILAHFDLPVAKAELRAAFSRTLPDGILPHIIYWQQDAAVTNWGREMRGDVINDAWGVEGTSAITQPPIMALAVFRVYERDGDDAFVRECYPILARHYRALLADRTLGDQPLAFIVNPDESGEDNSPRFDMQQGLAPQHTADESLDRRLDRIREHAACGFKARACMSQHFAVADVPFNIALYESLEYMAKLADICGLPNDHMYFTDASVSVRDTVKELLCRDGLCFAYDLNAKRHIETATWALFMPLYGELLTEAEAATLVEDWLMDENRFWTEFPVPSTARTEASYDPHDGFWRGPVWMAPNWFIYHGCKRYGFDDAARTIRDRTEELLVLSGFREQYHPHTGAGIGASNFTWGCLVIDMD